MPLSKWWYFSNFLIKFDMKPLIISNTIFNKLASIWALKNFFQILIFPDIDECSESIVCGDHAIWANVNGGYNCSCKEGYQTYTGKSQFTPNDGTYCQCKLHYQILCVIKELYKICSTQLWSTTELQLPRNVPAFFMFYGIKKWKPIFKNLIKIVDSILWN